MTEILNSLDLFLLSSTSEGFSISTIEAMACGVPVIVTKSGGPEEIVTHNHDGIMVNVDSSTEIAEAILKLAQDQPLQKQLITNALNTVKNRFTMDSMIGSYKALYTSN